MTQEKEILLITATSIFTSLMEKEEAYQLHRPDTVKYMATQAVEMARVLIESVNNN